MDTNKKNTDFRLNSLENTVAKLNQKELQEIIGGWNLLEYATYAAGYLYGSYSRVLQNAYDNGYNGIR
jgi:bacteriocin-like protein